MLDMEAAVLLHSAFWLLLLSMFQWGIQPASILFMVFLPILMVLASRQKIFGKYLPFYALVLVALVTLVGASFFSDAFLVLLNKAGNAVNVTSGFRFVPFHTDVEAGEESVYLLAAESVLMVVTSSIVAQSSVKKRLWPVILLTTIPVVLGLLLLLKPAVIWVALYVGALMLYVIHCSNGAERSGLGETSLLWQMLGAVLAFLVLFLALFYSYSGSGLVQNVRDRVSDRMDIIRYAPENETTSMPSGQLNEAESLQFEDETVLLVTMEQPISGYFRNYMGANFEDGGWKALSSDAMTGKYLGLDEWLAQRNFYSSMQLSQLYALESKRTGSAAKIQQIQVENIGLTSDKLHLFYEAIPTDSLLELGKPTEQEIATFGWKGTRSYSYTIYTPIYKDYAAEDLSLWSETLSTMDGYDRYEAVESLYSSFVHDNYLSIDDRYQELISATGVGSLSSSRYQDIVYGIRQYLQEQFTYSETIDTPENGEDALTVFATETYKGYEAHFATLAALMFREAGVPARYMEGYYLSPAEVGPYENAKETQFEILDSNAHAWVEIYEDKVGWIPVEVTPGFFSLKEEESPQVTTSTQRISKPNARPYYDNVTLPDSETPDQGDEQKKSHTWLRWLIGVACMALLLVGLWRGVVRYLEKRILATENPASTRFGFRFLLWLLRLRGYPINKEDPFTLVTVLGEEYGLYVTRVYQDTYSDESGQLTQEEREDCANYVIRQWKHGEKFDSSKNQRLQGGK